MGLRRDPKWRVLHGQFDPVGDQSTPTWINITGNIHDLAYTIFGQTYNPTTDPNSIKLNQAVALTSIVADWEYTIPNSRDRPRWRWVPPRAVRRPAIRASTSRSTMA